MDWSGIGMDHIKMPQTHTSEKSDLVIMHPLKALEFKSNEREIIFI